MKISDAVDTIMNHSICIKNMATCSKNCGSCCVAVKDAELLEAYELATEALLICKTMERYRIQLEEAS